jgi:hypothetical protein
MVAYPAPWRRHGARLFAKTGYTGDAITPAVAEQIVQAVNATQNGNVRVPDDLADLLRAFVVAKTADRTPTGRGVMSVSQDLVQWTQSHVPMDPSTPKR